MQGGGFLGFNVDKKNCWETGNVCSDKSEYPECRLSEKPEEWMKWGMHLVSGFVPSEDKKELIFKPGWRKQGAQGICMAPNPETKNYDFAYYSGYMSAHQAMALYNEANWTTHEGQLERDGIALTGEEMQALLDCKELGLGMSDFACKVGQCPSYDTEPPSDNPWKATGVYVFRANSKGWLEEKLAVMKDEKVEIKNLGSDTRKKLIAHIEGLIQMTPQALTEAEQAFRKEEGEKGQALQIEEGKKSRELTLESIGLQKKGIELTNKSLETQEDIIEYTKENGDKFTAVFIYNAVLSTLFLGVVGYPIMNRMYKKITGKEIRFDDYSKVIRGILKEMPDFEVTGRMEEAREAWRRTDTPGFRGIIFDLPTREGKDATVDAMITLKERGDPSVPKDLLDAPVVKVNAAEFHSETMYRGTVADKVAKIRRLAQRGPVVVYIPEIDIVFMGGGTSSGDTEAVAKLMLDVLEDPVVKRNLVIIGTTSRGGRYTPMSNLRPDGLKTMLETYPDLQGRFNWVKLHKYSLQEMIEILAVPRSPVRRKYSDYFRVEITPEMMEAAVRLSEYYHRGANPTLARFPAFQDVMENACRIARDSGGHAVTIDHLTAAVSEITKQSIDPSEMADILSRDFAEIERPLWDGTRDGLRELEVARGAEPHVDEGERGGRPAEPIIADVDSKFENALRRDPAFGPVVTTQELADPEFCARVADRSRAYWDSLSQVQMRIHIRMSSYVGPNGQIVVRAIDGVPANVVEHFIDTATEDGPSLERLDAISDGREVEPKDKSGRPIRELTDTERVILERDPGYSRLDVRGRAQAEFQLRAVISSETLMRVRGISKVTPESVAKFSLEFTKRRLARLENLRAERKGEELGERERFDRWGRRMFR